MADKLLSVKRNGWWVVLLDVSAEDLQRLREDRASYGDAFVRNGKRADPREVEGKWDDGRDYVRAVATPIIASRGW